MNDLITNGTEIKQRILSEINKTTQCIYVAMAYFTDRDIANAIVEAKNRCPKIDIILSSNLQNETVKSIFKNASISVHAFETGDSRGIMHHKFCLIDNRISINGSYNYSLNASTNNVENIQVSDDVAVYSQFLAEFERLKYNIDHNIGVNEKPQITKMDIAPIKPVDICDTFAQQLQNIVYSAADIDTDKYRQDGFKNSQESKGSIDIFCTEYDNIKDEIRAFATDEGLGSKKNVLNTNISIAYQSTKSSLEEEKDQKIIVEKRDNELQKKQINGKIVELRQEKLILESGNQNTGEKGLLQINKEIEKNKLERKSLEDNFIIKPFWSVGTILVIIGLCIFTFYLSIFFASAIYKVFFEGNFIRASLEAGINPGIPQLVDANAIIKIFNQGVLFGLIATLFFLIPVLLSNLKILGSENKVVNTIMFWIGLLVFDVLVSTMVALNTDEIKNLLIGQKSNLQLWEVVKKGEFWLIFVFGMFPLFIVHYFIDFLMKTFKKSHRELVDAEKSQKIKLLDLDMIEFNADKENLVSKVDEIDILMKENNTKTTSLETEINNRQTQIENKYLELQKQITATFDDYSTRINSGKIFTDVILDSVTTAYKSGFIEYLPKFYSTDEVTQRVKLIEQNTLTIN